MKGEPSTVPKKGISTRLVMSVKTPLERTTTIERQMESRKTSRTARTAQKAKSGKSSMAAKVTDWTRGSASCTATSSV